MSDLKLPWIPWYLNDWLASPTRSDMNLTERGMYLDTLFLLYQHGGSLEADQERLQRKLICTPEEFERNFPATLRRLRLDYERTGFITQDKVLAVLSKHGSAYKSKLESSRRAREALKRKRDRDKSDS